MRTNHPRPYLTLILFGEDFSLTLVFIYNRRSIC
jgi:hypothetical protein